MTSILCPAAEAVEFIDRTYEMYAVGKVEIYLVQPTELAQVRERSKENSDDDDGEGNYNASNRQGKVEPLEDDDRTDVQSSTKAILEQDDKEANESNAKSKAREKNRSNMRWIKRTDLGDHGGSARQPLASYDVG